MDEPRAGRRALTRCVDPARASVVASDSDVRDVNIIRLLNTAVFAPLRDANKFERVRVDEQTGTLVCPGDVDLDPDVICAALDLGPHQARIQGLAPSVAA